MLSYARHGVFKGLTNQKLREFGQMLEFYPGMPDFMQKMSDRLKQEPFSRHDLRVEHYIVSTGLRQIIMGSAVAPFVEDVWGCEFAESLPAPGFRADTPEDQLAFGESEQGGAIDHIVYAIDNTTKTRAVFEINKGANKIDEINVNSNVPLEERRVPFSNMVYVADGPSDIPVFSVVKQYGGRVFAVYGKGSEEQFAQVCELQQQGRVEAFGEADYRDGTQSSMWILKAVDDIAMRIVRDREQNLDRRVGKPPRHVDDE
jgi:hypothetical protein